MSDQARWVYGFKPRRTDVACPRCGVAPVVGELWTCDPDGCNGLFDTFASRGRCPHCEAQFSWTVCPACLQSSAHQAWYRPPANERWSWQGVYWIV